MRRGPLNGDKAAADWGLAGFELRRRQHSFLDEVVSGPRQTQITFGVSCRNLSLTRWVVISLILANVRLIDRPLTNRDLRGFDPGGYVFVAYCF